jgi:hypothetical protein
MEAGVSAPAPMTVASDEDEEPCPVASTRLLVDEIDTLAAPRVVIVQRTGP